MLHAFGISHPLPELPSSVRERLAACIRFYKETVRPYVWRGRFHRLSEQPKRAGGGCRWSVFQFVMPDRNQSLVFVFRLPGAGPEHTVRCVDLMPDGLYNVSWEQADNVVEQRTGRQLMDDGIRIRDLTEEGSLILHVMQDN
jgi:alpha-galactosidase